MTSQGAPDPIEPATILRMQQLLELLNSNVGNSDREKAVDALRLLLDSRVVRNRSDNMKLVATNENQQPLVEFLKLLEESSLGTPAARRLRRSASFDEILQALERNDELQQGVNSRWNETRTVVYVPWVWWLKGVVHIARSRQTIDLEILRSIDVSVVGALTTSGASGMHRPPFAQREDIKPALTHANENVERELEASEALFREIFISSSVGMAISDLNGALVRTNRALAEILGYPSRELSSLKIQELFAPDEAEYLKLRYRELLDEGTLPFRERHRLVRKGGDEVLVYLSASVLRHPDGTPRHYVTTVEDISDKYLLEARLRFQATHDPLTGLANRQRFIGKIEEALAGKRAVESITLYHVDLDGFAAVNDGPGRHVGDRLLQVVAQRLATVVEDEMATVARLDADEFGILIENTPTTPSPAMIAQRINDELGEPVYVGDQGIAITASIAVLEQPRADVDPAELLQVTDITLRRLKASGRRQWAMVDRELGARDRDRFNLAVSIPGAWESGEIELEYQPLVAIADRTVVAVQPLLRWDHTKQGSLDHDHCIEVLEETGLSLPIGRWMLSKACEQLMEWKQDTAGSAPQLYVELSRQQAADPDLLSTVQMALADSGMSNEQLRLGMPVQSLCMVDGLAEDNLEILVDLGISVVLHEFGTTRGDLACLDDLPVQAVKMSRRVVSRVTRGIDKDTLFVRAIRDLVPLIRDVGVEVTVGNIETEDQLDGWQLLGADTASGPLFGSGAPEEMEDILTRP